MRTKLAKQSYPNRVRKMDRETLTSSSFLLLCGRSGSDARARFEGVLVVVAADDPATLLLCAYLGASHPLVSNNLVERSTLLGVDFQHSANDVPAFSGK